MNGSGSKLLLRRMRCVSDVEQPDTERAPVNAKCGADIAGAPHTELRPAGAKIGEMMPAKLQRRRSTRSGCVTCQRTTHRVEM